MSNQSWLIFATILLLEIMRAAGYAQKPSGQSPEEQSGSTQALKFLGSYSVPSAIAATETGHVSANPPAPPAGQRLRRIEAGPTLLPPWPLDLAWTAEEISAACTGPGIPERARAVQQELENLPDQRAVIKDQKPGDQTQCLPLSWNLALVAAYQRRPEALDELAAAQPHAPSPAAGHLALALNRLIAGDKPVSSADFEGLELVSGEARSLSGNRIALHGDEQQNSSARPPGADVRERDALWARAIWAWTSGQLPEAREHLTRLTSLQPETAAIWFALGGVALDEARANSHHLAEAAPEGSWNRRLESEALESRYPDLARSILPKGVKPEKGEAGKPNDNRLPAGAPGPATDYDHPELELQRLESMAESPQILYFRVRAALRLSEIAYGRAVRSPAFDSFLCAIRALAAEEEDDEAAAESEYQAGLAENSNSAILHAGLGHLLRQQLRLDAARRELAKAVELDPTDPIAAFELGDIFQRQGEEARASAMLSRALEIDPGLLLARWSRAKAYLAQGEDRRALSDLEAAAPADSSGELQWQLARLYRKIGRNDLAQKAEELSEVQRKASEKKLIHDVKQ